MQTGFDYFKDRRFAPVFVITLLVLIASILTVGRSSDEFHPEVLIYPLLIAAVALLVVIWREYRWIRTQQRNRYKSSPLSRDELRKARSKLRSNRTGTL